MQLKMEAKYKDGTSKIVYTDLWCTILWERKFKRKMTKIIDEGFSGEEFVFLTYHALKNEGQTMPHDIDEFAKQLISCLPLEVNDPKADAVLTATD
tara:strand:+ start:1242 stop:1529 length:288 start_codon:yes stop_codon:yes gene_type:complete